jgi:vacuolar-type H+-ATPase subunit H
MDIINVIDRLDALVNTSHKLPATNSRLVDADKVMELVEQLRLTIPQDVRAAQEVIERKDSIINQAQIDARRTRNEAEEEYKARLEQNELVSAARHKADDLYADAERRASKIAEQVEFESRTSRAEADAYVVQALRSLETEMTSVLGAVRNGLDSLGATVHS